MDNQKPILKTECTLKKEKKDREIFDRYNELIAVKGSQIGGVYDQLKKEFAGIYSSSTIWAIRKRVLARIAQETETTI